VRRAWGRMVLALVVVAGAVVLVSSGGATQRLADADFLVLPGPAEVTYDELIAYRATFLTESKATLQDVRFEQEFPTAEGQETGAPVEDTCPTEPEIVEVADGPDLWICHFGTIVPKTPLLVVTTVWQAPNLGQETICNGCLTSYGEWNLNEAQSEAPNPGNDTFGEATRTATLLPSGAIPETNGETLRAGGYEIDPAAGACGDALSAGNLKSHGVIGFSNPVITKFCLPPGAFLPPVIPMGSADPGGATTITETSGDPRTTEICIAELGTECIPDEYEDQNFFSTGLVVTVAIRVADAAIQTPAKGRETIDSVSHNGDPMDGPGGATCVASGDCLLSINLDNKTKVWTILLTSGSNGFYDW
jgi:hypothetical protein